jgi:hypothetical protein
MPRRRTLHGTGLLLASGGLLVTTACGIGTTGNLVAPPRIAAGLCVETTPEDAAVTLNGSAMEARPCESLEPRQGDQILVSVSAPGFVTHEETVEFLWDGETVNLEVVLEAEGS